MPKNDITFEEVEQIRKGKEEQEARYNTNVQSQVDNTEMRHGQFEKRRYTRKAELAQLVAAWRRELKVCSSGTGKY